MRAHSLAVAALLAAVAVAFAAIHRPSRPNPSLKQPTLLLLTSLPLLFNEDFSLQGGGSSALKAIDRHYRLAPISVASPTELARGRLLLMAQPQPQSPDNLVALDQWVRRGGRLLLLADPMLEWPSKVPFGDPSRPPPMFVDTGLLAHWGLRLDAPDKRGIAQRRLGGFDVLTISPGSLYGRCAISRDRLVAHCRIGKGEAVVVADADLLNVDRLGRGAADNLNAVLAELASVAHS